jgi:hypothetical protein
MLSWVWVGAFGNHESLPRLSTLGRGIAGFLSSFGP